MTRGVRWYLVGSFILVALIALAGCSHSHAGRARVMAARRRDRVPEFRRGERIADARAHFLHQRTGRVRRRLSAARFGVGESGPLGYTDEAPVPPGAIPNASMPQRWPVTRAECVAVGARQFATAAAAASGRAAIVSVAALSAAAIPTAILSAAAVSAASISIAVGSAGRATVVAQSARLGTAPRR